MKKKLITPMIVCFFLFSCKKEITNHASTEISSGKMNYLDENDYSHLKVKNDLLTFDSFDYYESFFGSEAEYKTDFLIEKLKKTGFKSLKKANQLKHYQSQVDDFILNILNQDNIVKIDQWFIKINFNSQKVYATSDKNANAYELVLSEDASNQLIYEFSFEDEVIELLKSEENLNQTNLLIGCSDRKADKKSNQTSVHRIITHDNYYVDGELRSSYKKYGIYHTLISEGVLSSNDLNFNNKTTMWFYLSNCSYQIRCKGSQTGYTYPTLYPTSFNILNSLTVRGKYRWYGGTRQLKSYDYKVKMRIDHTYTTTPPNNFTPTYSEWTHISDS